jgi:hypothetical protein
MFDDDFVFTFGDGDPVQHGPQGAGARSAHESGLIARARARERESSGGLFAVPRTRLSSTAAAIIYSLLSFTSAMNNAVVCEAVEFDDDRSERRNAGSSANDQVRL